MRLGLRAAVGMTRFLIGALAMLLALSLAIVVAGET
jgi:hypothetical protein